MKYIIEENKRHRLQTMNSPQKIHLQTLHLSKVLTLSVLLLERKCQPKPTICSHLQILIVMLWQIYYSLRKMTFHFTYISINFQINSKYSRLRGRLPLDKPRHLDSKSFALTQIELLIRSKTYFQVSLRQLRRRML